LWVLEVSCFLFLRDNSGVKVLKEFLAPHSTVNWEDPIPKCPIINPSKGLQANHDFFNHPKWAQTYFEACHRSLEFRERWLAATGSWDDKIVVDIGCGPGNLYANVGGAPKDLIGVDVAEGSLEMAQRLGYTPILADAQHLPFISEFADIVAINASLHHCDDMAVALAESARLVKPGGLLVADHDPQLQAWHYQGIGMAIYNIRLSLYQYVFRNLHIEREERMHALATELHHHPGDGVTPEFFQSILEPMGFLVKIYPHNHTVGAEVLQGVYGPYPHWRYPVGQFLSGMIPGTPETALSLMCVARRKTSP
jgi:ubiquinone/menaquinone biosynthesis C-methylase UbiE